MRAMDHHHHLHGQGDLAELLDLDAEVLRDQNDELTAWIAALTGPVTSILDLGAGTGAGTFALLRRFPDARVTAVDADPQMLHRIDDRIRNVRTVQADLDTTWPEVEPVDLVWAAASMHHMADPEAVLRHIAATLNPGGTLALVELNSFPRFLPAGAAGGLETRLHAAADAARNAELPNLGADWTEVLGRTGFTVIAAREFTTELTPPLPRAAGRYARATLSRLRARLGDTLDATDRAALDDLLDGLEKRDDLTVRTTRSAWLARP